jgi:hypothetical protein
MDFTNAIEANARPGKSLRNFAPKRAHKSGLPAGACGIGGLRPKEADQGKRDSTAGYPMMPKPKPLSHAHGDAPYDTD